MIPSVSTPYLLTDLLTYWLTGWLTDWLTDWLAAYTLSYFIAGSYFHYGGGFKSPSAIEISPGGVISSGGSSQNNAYLTVVKATVDK